MHFEDMLIVRACKSKDPRKRLNSIVRRLYPNADKLSQHDLNTTLIYYMGDVYERTMKFTYSAVSPSSIFISVLNEMQFDMDTIKKHRGDTAFYMIEFFITQIRQTSKTDWPERMIWPKRY